LLKKKKISTISFFFVKWGFIHYHAQQSRDCSLH
jgi:hypothetical protein